MCDQKQQKQKITKTPLSKMIQKLEMLSVKNIFNYLVFLFFCPMKYDLQKDIHKDLTVYLHLLQNGLTPHKTQKNPILANIFFRCGNFSSYMLCFFSFSHFVTGGNHYQDAIPLATMLERQPDSYQGWIIHNNIVCSFKDTLGNL